MIIQDLIKARRFCKQIQDLIKARRFYKQLPLSSELQGKRVLLVTVRCFYYILVQELFFAHILAQKGAKVTCILDDGVLMHWDTFQKHENHKYLNPYQSVKLKILRYLITTFLSHRNIEFVKMSQHVNNEFHEKIEQSDIDNSISSVRRYFCDGKYDESNSEHQQYYNLSLLNCKLMKTALSSILDFQHYDSAIMSHGIYSVWGSAFEFLIEHGIKSYVYAPHVYTKDKVLIADTVWQSIWKDSDSLKYMKDAPFTERNRKEIKKFFEDRRNHTTKDTSIYYSWMEGKTDSLKINSEGSMTYAMFPNVIWDGDVVQRDSIFNGLLDCIIYTIKQFINSPNNLIIRCHPAEATLYQSTKRVDEIIYDEIPDIDKYKNISIIRSNEPLDTYSFAKENVDVAIVYDGILSLEMADLGIPVISPAAGCYVGGHHAISPATKAEYSDYLHNAEKCREFLTSERLEDMYKYAYWFIFAGGYTFPIYDEDEYDKLCFDERSYSKLDADSFRALCHKLVRIANGE